jgi:hypothetical protein
MTSWSDLAWIRDAWQGPIVVKGVHTRDDALRAVDHGAEAIVVSNHGGRQLDGIPSQGLLRRSPGRGPPLLGAHFVYRFVQFVLVFAVT